MDSIKSQLRKYEVRDYAVILFGTLLYGFGFNGFILSNEIVTGGLSGLCALIRDGRLERSLRPDFLCVGRAHPGLRFLLRHQYLPPRGGVEDIRLEILGEDHLRRLLPLALPFALRERARRADHPGRALHVHHHRWRALRYGLGHDFRLQR